MASPAADILDDEGDSIHEQGPRWRRRKQHSPVVETATTDIALYENKEEYRGLLRHRGDQAQGTLDRLQSILDSTTIKSSLWKHATVALQRLAWRTGLFPTLYSLRGVEKLDQEAFLSGSFGEIYRGRYQGTQVCIKMLRITQKDSQKIMKFYAYQAILWGQLSHRNILPFYGLCTIENRPCLISPWAENGNVRDYLMQHPDADRLSLIKDTTDGLAYLHARDIVHGDLKGSKVLVDLLGRACLSGFDLSSVYDKSILEWSSQSAAASHGGSFRWEAPELLKDEDASGGLVPNTKSSDIYAWACTSYEIFTGELPYPDVEPGGPMSSFHIILRKMQGIPPSQASRRMPTWTTAGLDDEMWHLLIKCWQSEPDLRPSILHIQAFMSRCITESIPMLYMAPVNHRPGFSRFFLFFFFFVFFFFFFYFFP